MSLCSCNLCSLRYAYGRRHYNPSSIVIYNPLQNVRFVCYSGYTICYDIKVVTEIVYFDFKECIFHIHNWEDIYNFSFTLRGLKTLSLAYCYYTVNTENGSYWSSEYKFAESALLYRQVKEVWDVDDFDY